MSEAKCEMPQYKGVICGRPAQSAYMAPDWDKPYILCDVCAATNYSNAIKLGKVHKMPIGVEIIEG